MKHQYPENHSEGQFADLIASIPKHVEDHEVQALHVEKLVKEQGWKVSRILDVGAGEGTFTELALKLLHAKGACSSYADVHVDVIEKDEELWKLCKKRLEGLGIPAGQVNRVKVADSGMHSPHELPVDHESLIAFSDRHSHGRPAYSLIIASHVTYYFNSAGVELAYVLGSRLLDEKGFMWFVVRDRECKFYRFREQLLAKCGLPDIHRECFSDAFLDRLRFLSKSPNPAGGRSIETRQRVMPLAVPEGGKARNLVSYLMWLSELDDGEVSEAARFGREVGGFSETHIWISQLKRLPEDEERRILAAINVSASCIDAIRRRVPDVQVHRISLASVVPKGKIPKVTSGERVDLELPIIIDKFGS